MSALFVGIDPGLSGALAVLDAGGALVELAVMPTEPHGKTSRVSGRDIRAFIEGVTARTGGAVALAVLEQVASRPGQGAPSVFTFGRAFGAVEGTLSALGLPLDYVPPAVWKRAYGLSADKGESVRKAADLVPAAVPWLAARGLKLTHDRAEAVLLAEFARRRWSGKG